MTYNIHYMASDATRTRQKKKILKPSMCVYVCVRVCVCVCGLRMPISRQRPSMASNTMLRLAYRARRPVPSYAVCGRVCAVCGLR